MKKLKRCNRCGVEFEPRSKGNTCCSKACAVANRQVGIFEGRQIQWRAHRHFHAGQPIDRLNRRNALTAILKRIKTKKGIS